MPFRSYRWEGDQVALGPRDPMPELRQTGPSSFVIEKGFCYQVGPGDPEEGAVYLIPGEDAGDRCKRTRDAETTGDPPARVVIPPTDGGGKTDLASVPPFMWWLVASYGNHTRAALLHDALYVDKGEEEP